ncbi:MAG: hypothetical protein M1838_004936 [Thelocarpon superellum]|nr:MAG: hypothetical protein M1838_004936 [Thelocarpon superellum]
MPQAASWAGTPSVRGSSEAMRMALLTFSMIGLQFTWGIEMTYCTPYLLQLGLTKSRTSLVWIAGPLSGLIMQPLVGVIADRSKSRWGRRRPFMIGGAVLVGLCLLLLGWTAEIVSLFVGDPASKKSATIALAILSIYAVDFAINAVQSCCRSLIVDTLPIPKQQLGSAWASRMIAIGHLVGYIAGTVDLLAIFGTTLGDTQFKQLCVISASALLFAVGVTSYSVEERVLIAGRDSDAQAGAVKMFLQIVSTTWNLPPRIRAICWVQFWSWIGWFPFLFYSTTWVGEIYFRYSAPHDIQKSNDSLGDIGRVGSLSLVVFSTISLLGSILLPWFVTSAEDDRRFTPRPPPGLAPIVTKLGKFKPDLLTAWMIAHLIFSSSMIFAPFVQSVTFATILVALCGIPWAVSCWAPFAFMGMEINRLGAGHGPHVIGNGHSYHRLSDSLSDTALEMTETHHSSTPSSPTATTTRAHPQQTRPLSRSISQPQSQSHTLHLTHAPSSTEPTSSTGELAGIYLGILNLFTTLPQFVGTFISTVVFALLEPGVSPELADGDVIRGGGAGSVEGNAGAGGPKATGPNAIGVCLFIGALSTLVAAYASMRLRRL